jgi:hypothetical protein
MAGNVRKFLWDGDRLKAAELVARGTMTEEQIGEAVGFSARQFRRWKQHPEFMAKVEEFAREIEKAVLKEGIANRAERVRAMNDRWNRYRSIISERAASDEMQEIPGGKSGMLVHDVKMVGSRDGAERADIYSFDTGLAQSILALEKQAAQEVGQWVEKVAPTTPDGEGSYECYEPGTVSAEDRQAIILALLSKLGH